MARLKRLKLALPQEMVVKILRWLPVMSLLRFKSVCKSWLSIISDLEFIKTHMSCSQIMATKRASLLMITKEITYTGRPRFASIGSQYYLHMQLHNTVIGSCNGIICLADNVRCYLWNPSTMLSKQLPKYPESDSDYQKPQLAFGFDSFSNDYKVLRFIRRKKPKKNKKTNKNKKTKVPVVQLYSTDIKSWKEIEVHDESISKVLCCPNFKLGLAINGVLYMGHMGQLVSFDLHTEEFTAVPFPKSKLIKSDILDFEGSVAAIFESKRKSSSTSLRTLAEIRGKRRWIKKFNIIHDDIHRVHSYLGGGLLYGKNGSNILYDYINNDFRSFPRLAKEPEAVLKYAETLASIKGFKPSVLLKSQFYPQV